MTDYRDPKVTTPTNTGSMGKWIGIALAALVLVGLLLWALGVDDDPEVTETPAAVETEPATTAPAAGQAPAPAPAN